MGIAFVIELLVNILRGFLLKSNKAAPYAKWLLKIRDYLLLLFPIEIYPQGALEDLALRNVKSIKPVDIKEVQRAAENQGFNIPFIKGK